MTAHNWIDLSQDADTGIETLRAHFQGHAYDPHWHDSYLVGVTEQGVQQFNCRRTRHNSVPGQVFLVEPGELHDGDAPTAEGFTYHMLYLDPQWLAREISAVFEEAPVRRQLGFADQSHLGRWFVRAYGLTPAAYRKRGSNLPDR